MIDIEDMHRRLAALESEQRMVPHWVKIAAKEAAQEVLDSHLNNCPYGLKLRLDKEKPIRSFALDWARILIPLLIAAISGGGASVLLNGCMGP
jgi:hypothetical protein